MTLNIFGREIIFEIKEDKKNNKKDKFKIKKDKFVYRFIVGILVLFGFGVIIETSKLKANYTIGSIAQSDIIAYKTTTYFVDILDKNIEDKIRKTTTPEFDKIKDVPKETVVEIHSFFRELREIEDKSDENLQKFIDDNKYNLKVEELKTIIEKNNEASYLVTLISQVTDLYNYGIHDVKEIDRIIAKREIKIDSLDLKLLKNFISPNLVINERKTLEKIEENIKSLKDKEVKIYKGDMIVKKGEVIDEDVYTKLEKLNLVRGGDKAVKIFGMFLTFVLMAILFFFVLKKFSKKAVESNAYYPSLITISIINTLYVLFLDERFLIYLLPFAMIPIILTIIGDKSFALSFTFFNMILISREETWFLVSIAVSIVAIYSADKISNRTEIVKIGIFIGVFQAIMSLGYGFINQLDFQSLLILIINSVFSGIFTGMLSLALLPYLESTFEILTDIRLLELSDFSHTLLKQLLVTAPGTFHHSIMVGALAESGAEAIGANATFARIASYYHDIGKMKRPEFFVENQRGGQNPHNKIKPSLSALIITSHTKDGYIMGKQNKLPKEILNIILEHHGTTLVQFFYYKALENGDEVTENDFRYSGPKPKTKEAGIILLADTIEAAVRSTEDKSKENLENLIRYLIKYKIDDNQLSESELTLGEIEKVIKAFLNTLLGAYHERIKYPKIDRN